MTGDHHRFDDVERVDDIKAVFVRVASCFCSFYLPLFWNDPMLVFEKSM
jgi:hypothetical protein